MDMVELVVGLLMIVNGEIKEHRIQDSMSACLKSMAETEIYMGEKSIKKLILK